MPIPFKKPAHPDQKTIEQRAIYVANLTNNIPSPCISICHLDANTGWCVGCWRSMDEIMGWAQRSDSDKKTVWAAIAQRAQSTTR